MNCPNCGFYNQAGANFCQNCGYRFDDIPQVEPIRVVVPQDSEPEPPTVVAQPPPVIIQQKSTVPTGLIVFLTVLITLIVVGGLGLLGFYLYTRSQNRSTVAVNVNTNSAANANIAKPSPSPDYEQRRNQIAPPDKRTSLVDEQFEVAEAGHRAIPFSVDATGSARLAGGFRVTKGKVVNFYVYPAEDYADYPTTDAKPVQHLQTRNKVINERLKPGEYYLVFENDEETPLTVAAEFFVVYE